MPLDAKMSFDHGDALAQLINIVQITPLLSLHSVHAEWRGHIARSPLSLPP
jgi:hypothetical protein